jgi:cobyrinic acid a,c-diamide synthase
MPHFLISAAHKSSGKTTLTLGLCAAFTARNQVVQPFKKGPDYIDPLWLSQAANRPCHNLDFYTMTLTEIQNTVALYSQTVDLSVIEGNMAFYNGIDIEGSNSNAALAELLGSPVILVLDTQGMTRSIAPLILGYQAFDKNVYFAGVILNKVGGGRHEEKLRAAMEYYTNVPVLGAVHYDERLLIEERHLGLIPNHETEQAQQKINRIAEIIAQQVDLEQILSIAQEAKQILHVSPRASHPNQKTPPLENIKDTPAIEPVKIGVVRDAAFGFYYPGDLVALETAGAELIFIDALHDTHLPSVDALFIGGGFPETQMEALANNTQLKQEIRQAIEQDMPVYAECGGLMYLSRSLTWQNKTCDMIGVLPFDTLMEQRPQGRGYVHLRETTHALWPLSKTTGQVADFHAHEFHYSKAINLPTNLTFAYDVLRGEGIDGTHDGIIYKNTLACYAHLRDVENNHWTQRFVAFIRHHKSMVNGEL